MLYLDAVVFAFVNENLINLNLSIINDVFDPPSADTY